MSNKNILVVISAVFFLMLISGAYAITGSIQNGRLVMNAEVGEEARNYIRVINNNEVSLTIELEAAGELAENVVLEEDSFVLQPGEDKRAYFTIEADEPGTTETKITVKFTPEEGNGIVLPATITLVASGEGSPDNNDYIDEGADNEENQDDSNDDTGVGVSVTPSSRNLPGAKGSSIEFSPLLLLVISSVVLVLILIILVAYAGKKKKGNGLQKGKINPKKRVKEPSE